VDQSDKPGIQPPGPAKARRADVSSVDAIDAQRRRAEELLKIERDLGMALGSAHSLDEALEQVLNHCLRIPEIDCGGAYLADSERDGLRLVVHQGLTPEFVETVRFYPDDSPQAQLAAAGRPVHTRYPALSRELHVSSPGPRLRAWSVIPILHQGQVEALLNLASTTNDELSSPTRDALEAITGRVGGVIARIRTEQTLQRLREQLEMLVAERTAELALANQQLLDEINERKNARSALLFSEERYRSLVEQSHQGIVVVQDERIVFTNPAFVRITGRPPAELQAMGPADLAQLVHPEDREMVAQIHQARLHNENAPEAYVLRITNRSGQIRWVQAHANRIRFLDRAAIQVLFLDITEKRGLDEAQQRAQRLESIGVLAGGIAHDFNNLLQAIVGNISLARMDLDPASDTHRLLLAAERASGKAQSLTQQLLTFSRGGAPVRRPLELAKLVRSAAHLAASGSSCRCDFDLPASLWPVQADPGQIDQLIHNLVLNACQAMPDGGVVTIACRNRELGLDSGLPLAKGPYVQLTFRDTGPGIDAADIEQVFDPYYTTKQDGSGLGLAVSHSIAKKHEGHLSVETEPGQGTAFHLYLPACDPARLAQPDCEPHPPEKKLRILVMDDEPMVRDIAYQMLTREGYLVEVCADGQAALDAHGQARAADRPFDLLILDLTVPGGMGGKQVMERLRAQDPHVRAIVSSGYSNDAALAEHAEFGFAGVLPKPYRLSELTRAIGLALSDQPGQGEPPP
jgi:PAS domain S-box-containing protein